GVIERIVAGVSGPDGDDVGMRCRIETLLALGSVPRRGDDDDSRFLTSVNERFESCVDVLEPDAHVHDGNCFADRALQRVVQDGWTAPVPPRPRFVKPDFGGTAPDHVLAVDTTAVPPRAHDRGN